MENNETEDIYLKAIYLQQKKAGYARAVNVAEHVGRTKATVSYTMKQLKRKGYIQVCEHGEIHLTRAGMERAGKVYEAYWLLKQLLLKAGADERMAEENACRMERVISPKAVDAIRAYLRVSHERSVYD